MSLTLHDSHRHTDRIFEVVRGGLHEPAKDVVAESWRRCLNDYQLHPDKPRVPSFLARVELEEHRARCADVIACTSSSATPNRPSC
jgi:sigma-54 dependent transcriptional regulator, acetoin dehydrogenase operon transcriptional activator AcoR